MTNRTVDLDRWARFDMLEKMANIGAEVGRTFAARRRNDSERYWGAIERAVDLYEATILTTPAAEKFRLREVVRSKEEYLRIATADDFDDDDATRLEQYFMEFAARCRESR